MCTIYWNPVQLVVLVSRSFADGFPRVISKYLVDSPGTRRVQLLIIMYRSSSRDCYLTIITIAVTYTIYARFTWRVPFPFRACYYARSLLHASKLLMSNNFFLCFFFVSGVGNEVRYYTHDSKIVCIWWTYTRTNRRSCQCILGKLLATNRVRHDFFIVAYTDQYASCLKL